MSPPVYPVLHQTFNFCKRPQILLDPHHLCSMHSTINRTMQITLQNIAFTSKYINQLFHTLRKQSSQLIIAMASQVGKVLAVFALLALCASAATAVLVPQQYSSIMTMGATDPSCIQYCMMAFNSPVAMTTMLQQQCGDMQRMMPSMMMMMPHCNCAAIWQMMQQKQSMRMSMQFSFTFGAMTPFASFFQQPFFGGAFFQQPFLGCGF
jgi:hypothetical protein